MLLSQFFMQNQKMQLKTGKNLHLHTANLDPWLVVKYVTNAPLYCSLCVLTRGLTAVNVQTEHFWSEKVLCSSQSDTTGSQLALDFWSPQDDRMGPSSIRQKCSGWNSGPRTCNSDHQGMKTGGGKLCLGAFSHNLPLLTPKSKKNGLGASRRVSGINVWGISASRAY